MSRNVRVLVVDDSVVIRQVVSDALKGDPTIEIVGTAQNGRVALEKLLTITPDVITLDLEMPEMDGLATLVELRKKHPKIPVVVFSTLTERGATATMDALTRGASDYVCKPSGQRNVSATMEKIRAELIPKIHALHARATGRPVAATTVKMQPMAAPVVASAPPGQVQLIVIAVSTGGPGALAELVPHLPANLAQPVLIVQHMPAMFTRALAQRLDTGSQLRVSEAKHQERLEAGHVYIAPGDYHMRVSGGPRDAWLSLDQSPLENGCRPAADPLFESAAKIFGSTVLGLVLTGLGRDATKGAGAIRKAGGHVWVQDEASSTVWGMPGSIVQAGLATRVLPLMHIARALGELKSGIAGPPPTAAGPKPAATPNASNPVPLANAPTTRSAPVKPRKP